MEESKNPIKLTQADYQKMIIESIKIGFDNNKLFNKTEVLVTTLYRILTAIYSENKKIIFIDAPTGTGKSIIGYMLHYCIFYMEKEIYHYYNPNQDVDDNSFSKNLTYNLTSSKMLQEQVESDVNRFTLQNFAVLKGTSNYECKAGTLESKAYTNFTNRICKGTTGEALYSMDCYPKCEYIQRRIAASESQVAVVNYAYYLTVMNAKFNMYFGPRMLTIADEGHLIPGIVTSMYGIDITMFHINKLIKVYNLISLNFGKKLENELQNIYKQFIHHIRFFTIKKHDVYECLDYICTFNNLCKDIIKLGNYLDEQDKIVFKEMFKKDFTDIEDKMIKGGYEKDKEYIDSLSERPQDIFIQTDAIGEFSLNINNNIIPSTPYYKFMVRDMSEAEVTRKYFIRHTNLLIIMSATIGSPDQFATLLGLKQSEYAGFSIPSTFDFSKSPIFLCNSGYLNKDSFQKNIQDVLYDACKICEQIHPNERGIIHTSTFQITTMLQEKLRQRNQNFRRYLFYTNSEEKEQCIKLMKSDSNIPYVIIGPSLYEGIDLKDDTGRFNIIVKAPYAGIDDYTRAKMERFTFYYERETLEKLQQAFGRTNRHKTDWSIIYCLDTSINKLARKLPAYISSRITNKVI